MKYLEQFSIILTISFIGEIMHYIIPLPVPASIYGLLIMFLCLSAHIIPMDMVKEASSFLIEIMPLMFIPAAVGLIESYSDIQPLLVPLIVITIASTVVVMAVSGRVTQFIIRLRRKS